MRTASAAALATTLEKRGVASTKSYLFFHCSECVDAGRKPPKPPPKPQGTFFGAGSQLVSAPSAEASDDGSNDGSEDIDDLDEESSEAEPSSSDDEGYSPQKKSKTSKTKMAAQTAAHKPSWKPLESSVYCSVAPPVAPPSHAVAPSVEEVEERRLATLGDQTALVAQMRKHMRLKGVSSPAAAEQLSCSHSAFSQWLYPSQRQGEHAELEIGTRVAVLLGLRAPPAPSAAADASSAAAGGGALAWLAARPFLGKQPSDVVFPADGTAAATPVPASAAASAAAKVSKARKTARADDANKRPRQERNCTLCMAHGGHGVDSASCSGRGGAKYCVYFSVDGARKPLVKGSVHSLCGGVESSRTHSTPRTDAQVLLYPPTT